MAGSTHQGRASLQVFVEHSCVPGAVDAELAKPVAQSDRKVRSALEGKEHRPRGVHWDM